MATVKVKFRPSTTESKEGTLFYQVIHERIVRRIKSGFKLNASEWDSVEEKVILPSYKNERYRFLRNVEKSLKDEEGRFLHIISRLESKRHTYSVDDLLTIYLSPDKTEGFFSFSYALINHLKRLGRRRMAETYTSAVQSLISYYGDWEVKWEEFDSDLMMGYETYLEKRGVCPNTISFYMRNLRAVYNRAVDKELTLQRYPFKHVYTGIDKTVKRGISLRLIRKIRDLDLEGSPSMDYARDLFMFSFYTRGMSFVDMAFLKKKDLQDGILSYRRRKTNQQLFIKWEQPMQDIVDKYDTIGTPYLLPIIKKPKRDEHQQYRNALHRVNKNLKDIGKRLRLAKPLTTYVSRHGWASIARSKNVSVAVISEALGHDSEKTTRIYLASLDSSGVDRANKLILKAL